MMRPPRTNAECAHDWRPTLNAGRYCDKCNADAPAPQSAGASSEARAGTAREWTLHESRMGGKFFTGPGFEGDTLRVCEATPEVRAAAEMRKTIEGAVTKLRTANERPGEEKLGFEAETGYRKTWPMNEALTLLEQVLARIEAEEKK